MYPIQADELASYRAEVVTTLPDSADVYRPTYTENSRGGRTASYTLAHTYPVAVTMAKIRNTHPESELHGQLVAASLWNLVFQYDADVNPDDRVVINGLTYEIFDETEADRSNKAVHVFLARVVA